MASRSEQGGPRPHHALGTAAAWYVGEQGIAYARQRGLGEVGNCGWAVGSAAFRRLLQRPGRPAGGAYWHMH